MEQLEETKKKEKEIIDSLFVSISSFARVLRDWDARPCRVTWSSLEAHFDTCEQKNVTGMVSGIRNTNRKGNVKGKIMVHVTRAGELGKTV